jgi:hypothetical protein
MGPWGLHYERTQTWWEMSSAWHEYLARCQYMLRQGLFVADLCYLRPELPDQTYFTPKPAVPDGYKYDECSAEALIARMSVKNGRLRLPDGMSYGLLVLPENVTLMTPALVKKIKQLVQAGATVIGPRPTASPSLSNYPQCDEDVAKVAAEVWGDCDGKTVTQHALGKGKVIWGQPLQEVLAKLRAPEDFAATTKLNWIHRHMGNREIYFIANGEPFPVEANCTFRASGLRPELWNPETGDISPIAVYEKSGTGVSIPLRLDPSGADFVVFEASKKPFDPVIDFTRNGEPAQPLTKAPLIHIERAIYGVPGDAQRTRDVKAKAQGLLDEGKISFQVGRMADGDDPAYGVVKTLTVEYSTGGETFTNSGRDPDTIDFSRSIRTVPRAAEIRCDSTGRLTLEARQAGNYELKTASGKTQEANVTSVPAPREIDGRWEVLFPPKWGAPEKITLDHLMSLSDSSIAGVKYFSGTATYLKTFDWDPKTNAAGENSEYWIDLGEVQVMARIKLNGHDLGILWKPPYRRNITSALQPGSNTLEIRVANLWPNRMIGDAALPVAERFTWSSYEPFTKDSPLPKSGLLGPVIIQTIQTVKLP